MSIILDVRRVISSLSCLMFALSLHASVPAATSPAQFNQSAATNLNQSFSSARHKLPITAAPADNISFYGEFYGNNPLRTKAQRKPGLFHRVTTALKKTAQKTAQKVNLIPN
ncbi:MAG: hypothetical protein WA738_16510 [Candidatus Angelobacter sp.]